MKIIKWVLKAILFVPVFALLLSAIIVQGGLLLCLLWGLVENGWILLLLPAALIYKLLMTNYENSTPAERYKASKPPYPDGME